MKFQSYIQSGFICHQFDRGSTVAIQRHLCGASDEAVNLLVPAAAFSETGNAIRDNRVRIDAGSAAMSDASVTREERMDSLLSNIA